MREHYLEITYRKGKPLAAYLYLSAASGVKSVRTESRDAGLLVDFGPDDQPIGLEITAPEQMTAAQINEILRSLDLSPMKEEDLSPLEAVLFLNCGAASILSQVITMSYVEYSNLATLVATVYKDTYLRVR